MGETAIVTAANSGIGRATAIALADRGFDVGFTHLDDEAGARETAAAIQELAEHGILVNSVAPGEIATAMSGEEGADPDSVRRPMIPLGRPGHVEEVAQAIALLVSPGMSYVTGHSFVVDGGMLLMAGVANQRVKD